MEKKKGFIARHMAEIKHTLVPENPTDSYQKKFAKKTGWLMFLFLMTCGTLTMIIAVSFAH